MTKHAHPLRDPGPWQVATTALRGILSFSCDVTMRGWSCDRFFFFFSLLVKAVELAIMLPPRVYIVD
jgi:hypothetical protein